MNDNGAVPIREILADPAHPAHNDVKNAMEKLERGEISMCACMGPMYGEPHCVCTMQRLGLPLNIAEREKDRIRFKARLAKLFGPGGDFEEDSAPSDSGREG